MIFTVDGNRVALQKRDPENAGRTLLDTPDLKPFDTLDGEAVNLSRIPNPYKDLIKRNGPSHFDVTPLTSGRIIEYIHSVFGQHGFSATEHSSEVVNDDVLHWLRTFWHWLGSWAHRVELEPLINTFYLVPTTRCLLVRCTDDVFLRDDRLSQDIFNILQQMGVSFLHGEIGDFKAFVQQFSFKSAHNGHHILDNLSLELFHALEEPAAQRLVEHLASCLVRSCADIGPLSIEQESKLRALPIHSIISSSFGRSGECFTMTKLASISEAHKVLAADGILPIPVIANHIFVKDNFLLKYIGSATPSSDALLQLIIDHLSTQSSGLQRAIVNYMVEHREDIPSRLIRRLSESRFVPVCGPGNGRQAPQDIFDPGCEVAKLLVEDRHLPRLLKQDDSSIIDGLRSLHLLKSALDDKLIHECVTHIHGLADKRGAITIARGLLRLIFDAHYDCSNLRVDDVQNMAWLPLVNTLVTSHECHHKKAHARDLYDEKLKDVYVQDISSSLVTALGWDKPLPMRIVFGQLGSVLSRGGDYEKLQSLIRELGHRIPEFSASDLKTLRTLTKDRPWIPISRNCLATTSQAVLTFSPHLPHGFYAVPSVLQEEHPIRQLLELMGCTDA